MMTNIKSDCSFYQLRDFHTHKLHYCRYFVSYDMDCSKCPYCIKKYSDLSIQLTIDFDL